MNYSEEEEKAIKIIEELLQSEEPICEYMLKHQEVEAMRKLLNIIETQKAEIERQGKMIDEMAEDIIDYEKDLKYEEPFSSKEEVIEYYTK